MSLNYSDLGPQRLMVLSLVLFKKPMTELQYFKRQGAHDMFWREERYLSSNSFPFHEILWNILSDRQSQEIFSRWYPTEPYVRAGGAIYWCQHFRVRRSHLGFLKAVWIFKTRWMPDAPEWDRLRSIWPLNCEKCYSVLLHQQKSHSFFRKENKDFWSRKVLMCLTLLSRPTRHLEKKSCLSFI